MSFKRAMRFTRAQEGGWADDVHDRGGRTRYGISSAAHPDVDLDTLTPERAEELFRTRYWELAKCHLLPDPVDMVLFDYAVHSGVATAVAALQRVVNADVDSVFGPQTVEAVKRAVYDNGSKEVALQLLLARERMMVRGFRKGTFSPDDPLRFLGGFWKRTLDLAYEIGATG